MKFRPIPFKEPMVRAILIGQKTQTRRAVKLPPNLSSNDITLTRLQNGYAEGKRPVFGLDDEPNAFSCVCPFGRPGDRLIVAMEIPGIGQMMDGSELKNVQQDVPTDRVSLITLEIVSVGVERLQDISETDAIAEGADAGKYHGLDRAHARAFSDIWESINGHGSWDANPWVWAIEFRRLL